MPYAKPSDSKKKKRKVMKESMERFEEGGMHSGSTKGPVVTNPKQAIAISMNMSGQSKSKKKKKK
jgi:hypothetical protein